MRKADVKVLRTIQRLRAEDLALFPVEEAGGNIFPHLMTALEDARGKLGRSWFTRRLPARTRQAKLHTLGKAERTMAKVAGWIR